MAKQITANLNGTKVPTDVPHIQTVQTWVQVVRVPFFNEIGKTQGLTLPPGFVLHSFHPEDPLPPSPIIKPGQQPVDSRQRFGVAVFHRMEQVAIPIHQAEEQQRAINEASAQAERRGDTGTLASTGSPEITPRVEGESEPIPTADPEGAAIADDDTKKD